MPNLGAERLKVEYLGPMKLWDRYFLRRYQYRRIYRIDGTLTGAWYTGKDFDGCAAWPNSSAIPATTENLLVRIAAITAEIRN
jgi:hypothetical protein